jgi:hypothetical protein
MTDPFGQPGGAASARAPQVRNGRYRLLGVETGKMETWSRVTTFAKAIEDMSGLHKWDQRLIVKGLGMRSDLHALAVATPLEDKAALQDVAWKAKEAAGGTEGANRGTAMHALTEKADRGDVVEAPAEWLADVEGYQKALTAGALVVDTRYIERFVAIPRYNLCGKFDRLYATATSADHYIGDVKTAKDMSYSWGSVSIQLALYANATHYWDDDADDWIEMPKTLVRDTGIVAHVPIGVGRTDLYQVDLTAGWEAAELCAKVRAWRSRRDLSLPMGTAPHWGGSDYASRIRSATCRADLTAVWQDANARGLWTEALEALGKQVAAGLRS